MRTGKRIMRIDYSVFTDTIREAVSAEQVGQDYGLNPGRDGRCRCIFCNGNRGDTLKLYRGNRGFYCFRCHTGGTVINLYMQLTGCGFRDAVKGLNEQYGLGLPLDGTDRKAIEQARTLAEQRKLEREKQERAYRKLLDLYWDACDAVEYCDRVKRDLAPKSPADPWRQRFIIALKWRDQLAEWRDWLEDRVYNRS